MASYFQNFFLLYCCLEIIYTVKRGDFSNFSSLRLFLFGKLIIESQLKEKKKKNLVTWYNKHGVKYGDNHLLFTFSVHGKRQSQKKKEKKFRFKNKNDIRNDFVREEKKKHCHGGGESWKKKSKDCRTS